MCCSGSSMISRSPTQTGGLQAYSSGRDLGRRSAGSAHPDRDRRDGQCVAQAGQRRRQAIFGCWMAVQYLPLTHDQRSRRPSQLFGRKRRRLIAPVDRAGGSQPKIGARIPHPCSNAHPPSLRRSPYSEGQFARPSWILIARLRQITDFGFALPVPLHADCHEIFYGNNALIRDHMRLV